MPHSDTTYNVQRIYDEAWMKLSPEERFLKGIQLIKLSRDLLIAGLKAEFPNISEEELKKKVVQRLYGA